MSASGINREFSKIVFARYRTLYASAVLKNLLPSKLLGDGDGQDKNFQVLCYHLNDFISLRRYESMNLQDIMQGIKVSQVAWLAPVKAGNVAPMSRTDHEKRTEILAELIVWTFDGLLVPLLRTNFYVTESATHRHKVFYFRQDVWRETMQPAKMDLKRRMLSRMNVNEATQILESREFAYSQLRFLPKEQGMRPIANLKQRVQVMKNGTKVLARAINPTLGPVFNVMNFEKSRQPHRVGNAASSVSGIHEKLVEYREHLHTSKASRSRLFFAKVDVRACFDSLPQQRLLEIAESICQSDEYSTDRYTELKPGQKMNMSTTCLKPLKKHHTQAIGGKHQFDFATKINANGKRHHPDGVLLDTSDPQHISKSHALHLLRQHVKQNVVKIGKRYWRQRWGISQGSILSSLLCTLCYAGLEQNHLAFLSKDACFVRLIDDFLLITPSQDEALRFLRLMFRGLQAYGVRVSREKCLANFETAVGDFQVPCRSANEGFPYCGMLIDERLNIMKEGATNSHTGMLTPLSPRVSFEVNDARHARHVVSGILQTPWPNVSTQDAQVRDPAHVTQ
ncbi:MAG: hypothetical protein Q9162_006519 [Coniocarpon cinnabarinum]